MPKLHKNKNKKKTAKLFEEGLSYLHVGSMKVLNVTL